MASFPDNFKPFARASLILIGLAWAAPFLQPYHRFPLTSFYSEWLAFALGLAAALLLLAHESWRKAELPAVTLVPVGLAALVMVQGALGRLPYLEQELTVILYLLWAALLILLGRVLRHALTLTGAVTVLAWFLVVGGMASSVIGLLQHFQLSLPFGLVAGKAALQVYGNVGQPNHFAAHLALSLASTGYLYCTGRLRPVPATVCAAIGLLLLTLSGSRSPWLYLGAFAALALWFHYQHRQPDSRRLAAFACLLVPGFILAQGVVKLSALASPGDWVTSGERLFQMAGGIDSRLQLWREAWELFLAAPVLGAGFGQFAWHHFLSQAATGAAAADGVYNHAHNLALHLLAETGLVGATLVIGGLVLWGVDLARAGFDFERWWVFAALSVIGIHSLLEHPLWFSYFLGMAAMLLGLGAERVFALRFAGTARLVTGIAMVAGWMNLVAMIAPYREFERLLFLPGSTTPRSVDDANFSRSIVGLYREPLLVPYVELAIAYGVVVDEQGLPEKLALAGRAVRFAPVSVVACRYAMLLALAGEPEAALAQLERALQVYPAEARETAVQLEALARRWPAQFAPLLELATAKSAGTRAVNP